MKSIMMFVVAALTFATFAQETDSAPKQKRQRPVMRAERQRPGRQMMLGGMGAMDPVLRVVMDPKMSEKIGLTEEQKTKIKELMENRAATKDLQEKMRKGMEKQSALLNAEKINEAEVMAALDEVWEARKEMAKQQTKRIIAVKTILTPEQVKQATEAVKAMRNMRRQIEKPSDAK